jgi:tRNA1(Val) A37 N6-methylase TrmN6
LTQAPGRQLATRRSRAIDELHQRTGIYTRAHVVDALLARVAWPEGVLRLLDPACGDGAFLERALLRILRSPSAPATPAELADRLEGWEIHPEAAADARARVASTLRGAGWRRCNADTASTLVVVNRDFLTEGPPPNRRYDVAIGNPPYLRISRVPELFKTAYRNVIPLHAREDLLHAFLDRCAELVRHGGTIACVTADRWLTNDRAAQLRERLGRRFAIADVERLDASSSFYSPKTRRRDTPPRCHPVGIVLGPHDAGGAALSSIAIHVGRGVDEPIADHVLSDVASVRIAPWLGTRGVFVVEARVAAALPAHALVPVVGPKELRGESAVPSTRFAIRTEIDVVPPDPIRRHLEREGWRMCKRGQPQLARWSPPESFSDFPFDQPMLVVPRIERRLRAVRVPAGVLPIDHNLCVISAGTATLDQLETILATPTSQHWIAAHADRLERGYLSIKTRVLRRLPIERSASIPQWRTCP